MANEKVWTPEQREAAVKIVRTWPCPTPSSFSERTVDLQCELTAKDAQLAEAVELLTGIPLSDPAERSGWLDAKNAWLKRNTGGSDGK